eukprot:TRINITY_DN59450_c0_g1_i1.p1 TRINITY_DN59450_c0_g1~~TRINITY_DN59450_c0_g1_i1.p1  ORF type:complete len:498 (+),score=125.51 TRINITY_DN59450_c0_g1_i1:166-1494(+)
MSPDDVPDDIVHEMGTPSIANVSGLLHPTLTPPLEPEKPVVDRMAVRKAELPWPYVKTSKSVQIVDTDGTLGVNYWSPPQEKAEIEAEEALIQTRFQWEPDVNPVRAMQLESGEEQVPHINYTDSYYFQEGNHLILREVKRKDGHQMTSNRKPTTDLVSFRTKQRIPRDGVAYMEMHILASCLHFGVGITEVDQFHPRRWVGYEKGSYGHWEDGRIGTTGAHGMVHDGRKLKPHDDFGVLIYSPPEEDVARLLFFKNEEPSGKIVEVPKNDDGWYFHLTMIGYHHGGAGMRISREPHMVNHVLEWLGRLMHPEDEDFRQRETQDVFESVVLQPFCKNRFNPFHLCNSHCRTPGPYADPGVAEGHMGQLSPNDQIVYKPTHLVQGPSTNTHSAKDRRGKWGWNQTDGGHRNWRVGRHDPTSRWGEKSNKNANPSHIRGNMRFR